MSENVQWFYTVGDEEEDKGPHSAEELLELHRSGVIDDETYVWSELAEDWILFREAVHLIESATEPPAEPPTEPRSICPHCHRAVQSDAEICPHCEQPLSKDEIPGEEPKVTHGGFLDTTSKIQIVRDLATDDRVKRFAVIGIVALLVLIALVTLPRWTGSGSEGQDVFDGVLDGKLPVDAKTIRFEKLYSPDNKLLTSTFAGWLCGEVDVAETLRSAARTPKVKSKQLLGLAKKDVQQGLECGEAALAQFTSPFQLTIGTEAQKDAEAITVLQAGALPLPLMQHDFNGLPGFCESNKKGIVCRQKGLGLFNLAPYWFVGTHKHIEDHARTLTSQNRHDSTNVVILKELAEHVDLEDTNTFIARPEVVHLADPCHALAPIKDEPKKAFLQACVPGQKGSEQQKLLASIQPKIRGLAVAQTIPTLRHDDPSYSWTFTLLAQSEDEAQSLELALGDFVRDWKAQIGNSKVALIESIKEGWGSENINGTTPKAFMDALLDMELSLDGTVVQLELQSDLSDDELAAFNKAAEAQRLEEKALLELIDRLRGGAKLSALDLFPFVSNKVAAWAVARRATQEECASLRKHVKKVLFENPADSKQKGLKQRVQKRFAPKRCPGSVMKESLVDCTKAATDLEAMAACLDSNKG